MSQLSYKVLCRSTERPRSIRLSRRGKTDHKMSAHPRAATIIYQNGYQTTNKELQLIDWAMRMISIPGMECMMQSYPGGRIQLSFLACKYTFDNIEGTRTYLFNTTVKRSLSKYETNYGYLKYKKNWLFNLLYSSEMQDYLYQLLSYA